MTLFLGEDAERWADTALLRFADRLDSAAPGTELARLAALNPQLSAQVRARAMDNVEQIEIYKSCDMGETFTADADCRGDPLLDIAGNPVGLGWRPYAIDRSFANVFTDQEVRGGRRYHYVVLARSRGAEFLVRDSVDTDLDGLPDAVGGRVITMAPQLVGPLATDGGAANVVSVYVPVSREAGSSGMRAEITTSLGEDFVPIEFLQAGTPVGGSYRLVAGNRITITQYRSAVAVDSTEVGAEDTVAADSAGVAVSHSFDAMRGTSYAPDGIAVGGFASGLPDSVGTITTVLRGPGAVLFRDSTPLHALLVRFSTPSGAFTSSSFPGFILDVGDTLAGRYARQALRSPRGDSLAFADTTVSFRPQRSERCCLGPLGGEYVVTWLFDPFVLSQPLELNDLPPTDSGSTEATLRRMLSGRVVGTVGDTTAATAALVGLPQSLLNPVRAPFTITNRTTGSPVAVAMRARLDSTRLLGTGSDTLRVTVPRDQWLPGDSIYLLEEVETDSTVGSPPRVVLNPNDRDAEGKARPYRVSRRSMSFRRAVFSCEAPRPGCNPLAPGTRGASGYAPLAPGTTNSFVYYTGFDRSTEIAFTITPPVRGSAITSVSRAQLDSIRVVPNPFVLNSTYVLPTGEPGVVFTHLPPRGTLRIYTVTGQFLQQLSWTDADLNGAGDLVYDLKTREGRRLASGLYLWALTTEVGGTRQQARGKFVVIQ